MAKYRFVGNYATEVRVGANTVPVGPGDFVDLSDADVKHGDNAQLFDNSVLLAVDKKIGGAS